MKNNRSIVCGEARVPKGALKYDDPIYLTLWDDKASINLKISDISRRLITNIPSFMVDLLEIASYVYCADQATSRGGDAPRDFGDRWRRTFQFHIPVRDPDRWNSAPIKRALSDTLNFLSDETFEFEFYKLTNEPAVEQYFEFSSQNGSGFSPEEVILFSGGLDSLGGAIQEAILDQKKVALVSHRSNAKIVSRQLDLVNSLSSIAPSKIFHVPVWAQKKDKKIGKDYTQRTRSFLYASLAAVVARLVDLKRIRFYENGVLSFNLPISPQVIGSQATRTTHPKVLAGFGQIFSLLFETPFEVENPFIWKTKTDVVKGIVDAGQRHLIKLSTSCAHTWEMTRMQPHCGTCSQCIDRRFAILASGHDNLEPDEMYGVDLLTGRREEGIERTMLESFVRTAIEIKGIQEVAFFPRFPEAARAFEYLPGTTDQVAASIINLYKRHADEICKVKDEGIKKYATELSEGSLDETCLVAIAINKKYKQLKPAAKVDPLKFPTPAGSTWGNLTIRFIDGHTVSASINGVKKNIGFQYMGMCNQKNNLPTRQWNLLEDFATGNGELTWNHHNAHRRNKKQVELLSKKLKTYFGMNGNPIEYVPNTKGWKTNFTVLPQSQTA